MRKILGISATYPFHPRLIKIIKTIKKNSKLNEIYFSFNLENKRPINEINYLCSYKYKNKLYKYLFGIKKMYEFLKKEKPDIIVCRGLIPFIFVNLLFVKSDIYYDIPDLIEEKKYLNILEKIFIKKAKKIFLASRFFYKYYQKYYQKIIILENYPTKEMYKLDLDTKFNYKTKNKTISFIGYIRYLDVLKVLVEVVKNKNIDLLFFGSGLDEEKLKNYCKQNQINNVYFFGEYNYLELYKFYNVSDFVWAGYDYRIDNVKYAISNKFYENILYEKIGIYSKNTELGKYVEKQEIGLTVDPFNRDEMEKLINDLINKEFLNVKKSIKEYKKNNTLFWEEQEEEIKKIGEI